MDIPLTTHLDLEATDLIRARASISSLVESQGWETLTQVIEMRKRALLDSLVALASDSGADYARLAGEIAGLQSIEGLVAGVMELGAAAERQRANGSE